MEIVIFLNTESISAVQVCHTSIYCLLCRVVVACTTGKLVYCVRATDRLNNYDIVLCMRKNINVCFLPVNTDTR